MEGADYSQFVYRDGVYQPGAPQLGSDRVVIEIPKYWLYIRLDGQEIDEKQFLVFPHQPDEDGRVWIDYDEDEYSGEIVGHRLQARHLCGNLIDVELIEPDGAVWQARGGYHFGEGFEDECGTAEDFYEGHIRRASFRWKHLS